MPDARTPLGMVDANAPGFPVAASSDQQARIEDLKREPQDDPLERRD